MSYISLLRLQNPAYIFITLAVFILGFNGLLITLDLIQHSLALNALFLTALALFSLLQNRNVSSLLHHSEQMAQKILAGESLKPLAHTASQKTMAFYLLKLARMVRHKRRSHSLSATPTVSPQTPEEIKHTINDIMQSIQMLTCHALKDVECTLSYKEQLEYLRLAHQSAINLKFLTTGSSAITLIPLPTSVEKNTTSALNYPPNVIRFPAHK